MKTSFSTAAFGPVTIDDDPGYALLRINAPGFFSTPGFKEFLDSPCVATWHVKGATPGECSDVFVTLDGDGEGSNAPLDGVPSTDTVPGPVWAELVKAARAVVPHGTCLIWLTNLQE